MIKQHKSISGTAGSCCNFTDKTESHPYQIPEITYSCSLFRSATPSSVVFLSAFCTFHARLTYTGPNFLPRLYYTCHLTCGTPLSSCSHLLDLMTYSLFFAAAAAIVAAAAAIAKK